MVRRDRLRAMKKEEEEEEEEEEETGAVASRP